MIGRNVSPETLDRAARSIGAVVVRQSRDPRRFVLRPAPGCKWRRTSASYFHQGRRVHAVCWHGYREFFRAVFAAEPRAVFVTSLARYDAETFEAVFPATGEKLIGAPINGGYPRMADACDCQDSGEAS